MMDLPEYNGQEIQDYQEVCPICDRICEPGAMLFCDHYLGVIESGDLIWIPTEKDKHFDGIRNFLAELDDLNGFYEEVYNATHSLLLDNELKKLIKNFEKYEFNLANYIQNNSLYRPATVYRKSNLFSGFYTEHFDVIISSSQEIKNQISLFSSLVNVLKAGYQVKVRAVEQNFYDPNSEETEEDGIKQEAIRRLKVKRITQRTKAKTE